MRAYTILVQPAEEQGHVATVPDLPGWAATGRTVEECVERARAVIALFVDDLEPEGEHRELRGRTAGGAGAPEEAEEEAVDGLRRAMAALRTVEAHLEEEMIRRPEGEHLPLRRAHAALLRARRSLVEDERRARGRALV
ncbi:MAG TPA: type II toxin-antitoxin system HicB family antitoxin [Candidatus Dormibacteraeota bacterium]|jgi:predicted RNase H-like HicB family nuclease|nr:type II toxin-antitoxin system HicB family antitoxin [Candidatus Dormibacteraeota bacterium]